VRQSFPAAACSPHSFPQVFWQKPPYKSFAGAVNSKRFFGPVTGPRLVGVLFLNSNISGGTSNAGSAKGVLEKAYKAALYPK
jgi:hypothetical protein